MTSSENVACDVCGASGAQVRKVSRSYGSGASLLVIENVPVVQCPACGSQYLHAETLHQIEHIRQHQADLAPPRSVPVATLA